VAALNLNVPRYFIHARLGERQLGVYSSLAYATVAMVLVSDSIGHCAVPRLSRLYATDRHTEFRSLLLKLVAAGAAIGAAGIAGALCAGKPLLALLYGKEYAAQHKVFFVLILATAIYCVACMFTSAITAARCFRIQVPLYTLIVTVNTIACALWIPRGKLAGAAAALAVASAVHLALGASVLFGLLWAASAARNRKAGQRPSGLPCRLPNRDLGSECPLRLLHIVGESRFGGAAAIILGLCGVARSEGWLVDVLTTARQSPSKDSASLTWT